nr:hypothetical protein [Tanacetum cinerariifolium]
MTPLPPRDQIHLWLRYQVEGYTKEIIQDFKLRLETIFGRHVNRVHVLNFNGLTKEMRQALTDRLRMVYAKAKGHELFTSHAWRSIFEIRTPLVREFIQELRMTWRDFILALGLHTAEEMVKDRLISFSISGRGQAPEKVTAADLFYMRSMDPRKDNVSYLLAQYLFRHAEGKKSRARISGGHFIGINGIGPKRQPIVTASVLEVAEGAPLVDEGVLAIPSPVKAPHPPPTAAQTRTMP